MIPAFAAASTDTPVTDSWPPSPTQTSMPNPLWPACEIWTFETVACVKLAPAIAVPVVLVMCVPSTWRSVAPLTPPEPAERPTPTSEIVDPLTNRDPEDAKPRSPNRTVASTNVPDAPVADMARPSPPRFGPGLQKHGPVTGHSAP